MVSKARREASGACLDHVSGGLLGDDAEGGMREAQPQRSEWRAATVSEHELGANHLAGGGRREAVRHRWNVARPWETRTGAGREGLSEDWGFAWPRSSEFGKSSSTACSNGIGPTTGNSRLWSKAYSLVIRCLRVSFRRRPGGRANEGGGGEGGKTTEEVCGGGPRRAT